MRNNSIQSVERAGTILLYLAEHPNATLEELGSAIGCSRTTAHRLLNGLARSGLVTTGRNGRPAFGPTIARLYGAWSQQTQLRQLAYPYMVELRNRSSETVVLHVRQGHAVVCAESVESEQHLSVRVRIGELAPLVHSSSGKLLLAALAVPERSALLESLGRGTPGDRAGLEAELAQIREHGYATGYERIPGGAAVAAPIWDGGGELAGTITVAGPAERLSPPLIAELAPVLCGVARAISRRLGYEAAGSGPRSSSGQEAGLV